MAAEQGGGAKKAEGLSWLASYARGQLNRIGTASVRFAEPLSLREAMAADGRAAATGTRGGCGCRRWRSRWPCGSTG